eukprot:COSAG02_NODE_3088_length_7390_cov_44.560280_3_plen_68_part_00
MAVDTVAVCQRLVVVQGVLVASALACISDRLGSGCGDLPATARCFCAPFPGTRWVGHSCACEAINIP